MTHYPFPGLQVVHRSASSTFPRNLPGVPCNDNVSVVKDLTPAARTSTSLPAHRTLLSCVPWTDVGPTIWSSHLQSSLRWAGEPDKTFMLVHSDPDPKTIPALCYSRHRKGGTAHQHHHRLSPHPVHVQAYARYRCYVPLGIKFPSEHHPSRAYGIRQSGLMPMQPGKYSTARRGRDRITKESYEAEASREPSSRIETHRNRGVEQEPASRYRLCVL